MALDENEIVARAREGDEAAYAAITERHYADCLRYAYRMLDDHADAEDVVQETFVRAFRALHRYDHRDRLRAWLLQILRNRCRSYRARHAWRRARLRLYGLEAERSTPPPADPATADVQRALQQLAPKLREAFLLKHVEELSYDEMARITGASESALKMRVKRACDALLGILGEQGHGNGQAG